MTTEPAPVTNSSYRVTQVPISVIIPTFNEEVNILRCLQACSWSDDIIVFDSFSTDRTVEIALAFGARVIQRKFDTEPNQRNAMRNVQFKHEWVFNPDADEVGTSAYCEEMLQAIRDAGDDVAVFCSRRKDMFRDKWIRHASADAWFPRLWRPDKISFEREINPIYVVRGKERRLQERFIHHAFAKGLADWFAKHNRYSDIEARIALEDRAKPWPPLGDYFSGDRLTQRLAFKRLHAKLPGRPMIRFVYMYFWRRGFLDGSAGLDYCVMQGFYEFLIVRKADEHLRSLALQATPEQRSHLQGQGKYYKSG